MAAGAALLSHRATLQHDLQRQSHHREIGFQKRTTTAFTAVWMCFRFDAKIAAIYSRARPAMDLAYYDSMKFTHSNLLSLTYKQRSVLQRAHGASREQNKARRSCEKLFVGMVGCWQLRPNTNQGFRFCQASRQLSKI